MTAVCGSSHSPSGRAVDGEQHRRAPVVAHARELDRVVRVGEQRVRVDVRVLGEARVAAVELDPRLAAGVEHELHADRQRARILLQRDEQLVGAARVRAEEVEALDRQRAAVLLAHRRARAGRDLGDVDAGRVVVAQRDLDVAHGDGVEQRVGRDRRVLDDDDAVALRARVVDGEHVDPLAVEVVAAVEREHERALVLVDGDAVDELVALEVADVGAVAARPRRAEPDRVGLAVVERVREAGDRLGVGERVVGLLLRRARGGDRDVDERAGIAGKADRVAVDVRHRAARRERALADGRALVALVVDDDLTGVGGGEVVVDAVDRQAVVERVELGLHAVVDRAADALELARDDVLADVAGDVDRVRAEAADDAVGRAVARRDDEELVVALEAVDLDDLDVLVAHVQAGAEDALDRDDDVVGELGAEDHDLVEARAAVDGDRGVDVVGDLVLAAARADVQRPRRREAQPDDRPRDAVGVERDDVVLPLRRIGGRRVRLRAGEVRVGVVADAVAVAVDAESRPALAVVAGVLGRVARARAVEVDGVQARVRVGREIDVGQAARVVAIGVGVADGGQREGAHDEDVVVVVALQAQLGLVGVDGELVVAGAAGGDERRVRAGRQPAARRRDELGERVVRQQRALVLVALEAEDLADLERVVAGAAVERRDRRVVVDEERVVAAHAVDRQAAVERRVVGDPLDEVGDLVADRAAAVAGETAVGGAVAVQQGDERGPVGDLGRRRAGRRDRDVGVGDAVRAVRVDALRRAQQEDVVGRVAVRRAGDVAVEEGVVVVEAVDRELVDAVVRGARVEHVDDVVADRVVAAGRVDGVVVGLGLAVEREAVAGARAVREPGRRGEHVGGLQVPDREEVLAVGFVGRRDVLGAVHPRLRADEDVAVGAGRSCRSRSPTGRRTRSCRRRCGPTSARGGPGWPPTDRRSASRRRRSPRRSARAASCSCRTSGRRCRCCRSSGRRSRRRRRCRSSCPRGSPSAGRASRRRRRAARRTRSARRPGP